MRRPGFARGQTQATSDGVLLAVVSSVWSRDMWVGRAPSLSMIQAVISTVPWTPGSVVIPCSPAERKEVKWSRRRLRLMDKSG